MIVSINSASEHTFIALAAELMRGANTHLVLSFPSSQIEAFESSFLLVNLVFMLGKSFCLELPCQHRRFEEFSSEFSEIPVTQ
jgi:hypothetical protein